MSTLTPDALAKVLKKVAEWRKQYAPMAKDGYSLAAVIVELLDAVETLAARVTELEG